MPIPELAVALAERCADRVDDHCAAHRQSLHRRSRATTCTGGTALGPASAVADGRSASHTRDWSTMTGSTIDEVNARVAGAHRAASLFLRARRRRSPTLPLLHSMQRRRRVERVDGGRRRDLAAQVAQGLLVDRVAVGERVLLMMRNRPDFHWLDLAAQFVRATPVSIYNSSSPEEIQYLASHAGARIAIVEDAGFLDRLLEGPRRAAGARADLRDRAARRRAARRASLPAERAAGARRRRPRRRSPPPPHPTTWRR